MSPAHRQSGVVLIAVLWVISALAMLVASILAQTRTDLQLTYTQLDLAKARAMAEAGVYQGVYELLRSRRSVRLGLPENAPRLEWRNSTVSVLIRNEAGKIDVNTAAEALMQSMFVKAGATEAETRRLTRRYDRMLRPGGGDAATRDADAGFSSIEDFATRLGLSRRLWRAVAPWITVYNGQSGINPYVADPEVLSIVPGFNAALVGDQSLAGSPYRLQSPFMTSELRYFTDRLSPVYTITVRATVGGASTTVEATIEMSAHRSRPYTILSWSEAPRFLGG